MNDEIRISPVRVVSTEGEMLGEMAAEDALEMAREAGLDLVEINPDDKPPVCKIMDFGKMQYERRKKQRGSKKTHQQQLKQIRLRGKTGQHDIDFKVKKVREFLNRKDKVKITELFPGFDRIYLAGTNSYGENEFFASLARGTPHRELLRGEWVAESALEAHWSMGKGEPSDIACGQSIDWIYLSQRVQQVLSENNLTGWTTYPIVLHNKAGDVCPGYAGLSITGRCGPIDTRGGQLVPGEDPESKFARRVGLFFDETTWDGSDFFCPAGDNSYIFVTENVKNVFEQRDIGGFDFTPLTEATWIP